MPLVRVLLSQSCVNECVYREHIGTEVPPVPQTSVCFLYPYVSHMQFEGITFLKCPECEKVINEEKETLNCHTFEKKIITKNNKNKTKNISGLWVFKMNGFGSLLRKYKN